MGILGPARKLTDPLGNEWEFYVSRIESTQSRLYRELMSVIGLRQARPDRGSAEGLKIELVTYLPHQETYLWMTTTDHVARVIDQIVAGLEQGYLARPLGAVYHGSGS